MRYIWFWTFWHWSKESLRDGSSLLGPLHGIGGNWDEWYRHEAGEVERHAIAAIGGTDSGQREFVAWLQRHWAHDVGWGDNSTTIRFVLGQLAALPPFDRWAAFRDWRATYGLGGVSAIVLAEQSQGEAGDVRSVEGVLLPTDGSDGAGSLILAEEFHADRAELDPPYRAAESLLNGKGLMLVLALWMALGVRPYPRWLRIAIRVGWMTVGALIAYLLFGPDPADQLFWLSALLVSLWSSLTLVALVTVGYVSRDAWREGRDWTGRLAQGQLRLRMNGGLTLQGGSAGVAFCLNTLLAVYRAHPNGGERSWLWRRFFRRLDEEGRTWAATGVVTSEGAVKPVALEPKLRACLRRSDILDVLTPRQANADRAGVHRQLREMARADPTKAAIPMMSGVRLGFAAENPRLRSHPFRHLAQAVMTIGGFSSRSQLAVGALAVVTSITMLAAFPDLRSILRPHPAPMAIGPSSSSPYHLWVSLDTRHPDYFRVMLESSYWANRHSNIAYHDSARASVRAELRLRRLTSRPAQDESDGIVWIERRRRFLLREFTPGERVGHFTLPYLSRLPHE